MARLSAAQEAILLAPGNRVVTACPGSGKTRLLVEQVRRFVELRSSRALRVVALTFTNRAADEVLARIDDEARRHAWVGTIHSFCLQWILRPYAAYVAECRRGFVVAEEPLARELMAKEIQDAGLGRFTEIATTQHRDGEYLEVGEKIRIVIQAYKSRLRESRALDYDDVLYLSYRALQERPEIARTIAGCVSAVCIDEVQDLQDLQYGIVSSVWKARSQKPWLFFVGDPDQSIYSSMGATSRNRDELNDEFPGAGFEEHSLLGNYRSAQRIVDVSRKFRPGPPIAAVGRFALDPALVTRALSTVRADDLAGAVAALVKRSLDDGVPAREIAVLGPQWWHIEKIGKALAVRLAGVPLDAPGLSPLGGKRESVWFYLARLFLTPRSTLSPRGLVRYANDALEFLEAELGVGLPESIATPEKLLREICRCGSPRTDGIAYLSDVLGQFIARTGLGDICGVRLQESLRDYLDRAAQRIAKSSGSLPSELDGFRRCFAPRTGVVVSTLHGCKGEEYQTVIAFGLLKNYVPNWRLLEYGRYTARAREEESKLLYVVATRAKRKLHLIAESGRTSQAGKPLEPSHLLRDLVYAFD